MQHQTIPQHPPPLPSPVTRSNGGMVDTKDLKSFGHSGRAGSSPASSTPTPPRPRVRSPHPPIPDPGPAHTPTYPRSGAYPYPHLFPDPRSRAYHLRLFSSPQKSPTAQRTAEPPHPIPKKLYHNSKPIQHPLNDPISISQPLSSHTRPDPMLPISPQMIPQDRLMALQPRRRRPPSAHRHEIHRNIFRRNAVDIDQPQQLLEIRSHLKLQVKRTQTLIHMPAAIKRRMRRHEAEPHLPPAERTRAIIPHAFGQIVRIDEMNVAIHRIHPIYLARHTLQHIIRRIEIITVEYPHHIARSQRDPLVHRIIQPTVRLADPPQSPLKPPLVLPDNLHRIITRPPVDHDHLHITIPLPQHTLQSITQRITTIKS